MQYEVRLWWCYLESRSLRTSSWQSLQNSCTRLEREFIFKKSCLFSGSKEAAKELDCPTTTSNAPDRQDGAQVDLAHPHHGRQPAGRTNQPIPLEIMNLHDNKQTNNVTFSEYSILHSDALIALNVKMLSLKI